MSRYHKRRIETIGVPLPLKANWKINELLHDVCNNSFSLDGLKMYFCTINQRYIEYLKPHEPKLQDNYEGKRVYIGVVLNIGELTYFAPLSSYKPKQDKIKNDTVIHLHERGNPENKLGVIHVNNMFPVPLSEIHYLDFSKQKQPYAAMLRKQYEFVTSKEANVLAHCAKFYHDVVVRKHRFYSSLSCQFQYLEELCLLFGDYIQNIENNQENS